MTRRQPGPVGADQPAGRLPLPTSVCVKNEGISEGCGASHGAMAGRGEPECRQLLLETVRIVPEGAWCGGTDGLSGTCAECEGDALPCLALQRGPRQMQNELADRADDLDPELEQSVA